MLVRLHLLLMMLMMMHLMLETMQRGVDEAHKLFPSTSEFTIEYRNPKTTDKPEEEEGEDNGSFEG